MPREIASEQRRSYREVIYDGRRYSIREDAAWALEKFLEWAEKEEERDVRRRDAENIGKVRGEPRDHR